MDTLLEEGVKLGRDELKALLGKAATTNAKLAYQAFEETFGSERFAGLRSIGARVQRPLWASTGTKNPAYSDLMYVEPLIGPDTVNTVPPATLTSFLEHGRAAATLHLGAAEAQETMEAIEGAGVSMEQVTDKLLADGVRAFADSFDKLMANIQDKGDRLLSQEHVHPSADSGRALGPFLPSVESTVAELHKRDVVGRIWGRDHTVWKPDPKELADRLGVADSERFDVRAGPGA